MKEALLSGEPGAVRVFQDACLRPLYSFCFHRLGRDHHATEEVVQETLLLALDRIADFDPERGDLHTWLAYLSRNGIRKANDERRRFARLGESEPVAVPDENEEEVPPRESVEVALERLPSRYRSVLERKYLQGESVRAIAAADDTSEKAVESLLVRARSAFRGVFLKVTSAAHAVTRTNHER